MAEQTYPAHILDVVRYLRDHPRADPREIIRVVSRPEGVEVTWHPMADAIVAQLIELMRTGLVATDKGRAALAGLPELPAKWSAPLTEQVRRTAEDVVVGSLWAGVSDTPLEVVQVDGERARLRVAGLADDDGSGDVWARRSMVAHMDYRGTTHPSSDWLGSSTSAIQWDQIVLTKPGGLEPGDRIRYTAPVREDSHEVWQARREQDSLVMGVEGDQVHAWLIGDRYGAMFWSAKVEHVRVVTRGALGVAAERERIKAGLDALRRSEWPGQGDRQVAEIVLDLVTEVVDGDR